VEAIPFSGFNSACQKYVNLIANHGKPSEEYNNPECCGKGPLAPHKASCPALGISPAAGSLQGALTGAAQSPEVQCKAMCALLFTGQGRGRSYEPVCNKDCIAGANLGADEQCSYCAVEAIPFSGFNSACQKYVNLIANHGKPSEEYNNPECCGKGPLAPHKASCPALGISPAAGSLQGALTGAAQSPEVQCKAMCAPLFTAQGRGRSYESVCNKDCIAGANRGADEQCSYCAETAIPFSGYNSACQKYVNLIANNGKPSEDYNNPECCGKGPLASHSATCSTLGISPAAGSLQGALNGAAQSPEVQCKTMCAALFIGQGGASYESVCNKDCIAGANRGADEQCLYCAETATPFSGFNSACQKYVNLIANHGIPSEDYNPECCGKGSNADFHDAC